MGTRPQTVGPQTWLKRRSWGTPEAPQWGALTTEGEAEEAESHVRVLATAPHTPVLPSHVTEEDAGSERRHDAGAQSHPQAQHGRETMPPGRQATCRDRLLETWAVPEPQGRRPAADAEQRLRPAVLPTRGGRLGSARPPSRGGGQGGSWVFGGVGRQGQQGGGREGRHTSRQRTRGTRGAARWSVS